MKFYEVNTLITNPQVKKWSFPGHSDAPMCLIPIKTPSVPLK